MFTTVKAGVVAIAGAVLASASLLAGGQVPATARAPLRPEQLQFSTPATAVRLDMGKLKGQPSRLAWSPDGTQLYVQTLEGQFGAPGVKLHHYLFDAKSGAPVDAQGEPGWASQYWVAKSAQASPDNPSWKIDLKTEQRQQRTTSAPMGGDLARGAPTTGDAGTSAGDAGSAAFGAQSSNAHVMMLKGVVVGEFVNAAIVPGLTFGWGPRGAKVIAYVAPKTGRVTVMDLDGKKQEINGTQDAILPAWSPDATRLAWLQKEGRKTFVLMTSDVTQS